MNSNFKKLEKNVKVDLGGGMKLINNTDKNLYKPVVPVWVGDILAKEKKYNNIHYPFKCSGKTRKEWDKWKTRYSRKLKYARLNGWIVED